MIHDDFCNDSPDMTFELIDKCPAGGGEVVLRTASRHALKARIRITESEAASMFNGCLYMRATVNSGDGQFNVYVGDYDYSNARENHAAD